MVIKSAQSRSIFIDDRTVSTVIIINLIAVFILSFPNIEATWKNALQILDYCCLVYFLIEIVLKIAFDGWGLFWQSRMNRFDLAIVLVATPALIAPVMGNDVGGAIVLLRAGRFLRLLRAARFIPNAEHLWRGIGRALRASVGLVLALSLYNIVLGLLACQLFHQLSPSLFGDPLSSTYTIFRVFTIEGWHEVPATLVQKLPPGSAEIGFIRAFFVFVVVTGGLLGLSLTNAVLVDEMVMDNTDPVERKLDVLEQQVNELIVQNRTLIELVNANSPSNPPQAESTQTTPHETNNGGC